MMIFSLLQSPANAQRVSTTKNHKDRIRHSVDKLISQMTMEEKVGQLIMAVTHPPYNAPDQMPDEKTKQLIQEYGIGSVIIYNKRNPEVMANYTNQLQKWASETRLGVPLLISADLEYGTTHNIKEGTTAFPRQMGIGATRNLRDAQSVARVTAAEAKAMGIHWNFSPVADVNTNPNNPVIGVRSFGENTELVSKMTSTMVRTYQKNGIIASAKHFPGHGDTDFDSHLGLSAVTYDRETLNKVHLPPFQAAIDAGVESIMTSHVIIKAIDPELPATLSYKVLTGLLRNEMGYDGIIVTDAMDMYAIAKNWGTGEAAVMSIKAGADVVMATGSFEDQIETYQYLLKAVKGGEISEKRLNESVRRILTIKFKYHLFSNRFVNPEKAAKISNNPHHKALAEKVSLDSITLVKNNGVLPINASSNQHFLVAGVIETQEIKKLIEEKGVNVTSWQSSTKNPSDEEIQQAVNLSKTVDNIIVLTYSQSSLPEGQIKLVNSLIATGKPVIALSLGLPYDIKHFSDVHAYIATYAIDRWQSISPTAIKAAVNVLFGAQPGGKLPVTINEQYRYGHGLSY